MTALRLYYKIIGIFLWGLFSVAVPVPADELSQAYNLIYQRIAAKATPDTIRLQTPPQPLNLLAKSMIRSYQIFLSSQDRPSCVFSPSCSQFGAACFSHYNPLKAFLLTGDRLQRCHTGAQAFYPYDPLTDRLFDPVENYKGD